MTSSVAGQAILVVGAGSGIGRGTAQRLGGSGAHVACLDREAAAAEATAAAIVAAGGEAMAYAADLGSHDSVTDAFAAVTARCGQVHGAVNSAGIQGPLGKRTHEIAVEDFDATYTVNLRGALVLSRILLAHMLEHGYGRIAHVASIAGKEGNPNMVAYSATKAGLIGMVKSQGKEYARDGITINALAPAVIHTPFLETQPREVIDYMTEKIPMGRFGTIEETAAMLEWMVSPACSFTTGFTFDLSGGRATY